MRSANIILSLSCVCLLSMAVADLPGVPVYAQSHEVCHLVIDGDPMRLDDMTIDVPLRSVALDPSIQVFPPDITLQGSFRVTASIVLIIDDSGSMVSNDPDGNRYAVTEQILDEIYQLSPQTRVGVVSFRNWLAWDWRKNDMFRKVSDPFRWNDSYYPCVPLDTLYEDGQQGIDKIKGLFELDQWNLLQAYHQNDSTERTRPLDSTGVRLPKNKQGTDITLAFDAAKDALRNSPTPRERRFCVFFSDGYHGSVDQEMEETKLDYIQGEDVPATFVVFLGDSVKQPPEQLTDMVTNIQNNGYSRANRKSELWSIESKRDTLLDLMQREILSDMFVPEFTLSSAQIQGVVSTGYSDTSILLGEPYPLNEDSTNISMQYTFTYVDSIDSRNSFDTTFQSQFTFVRSAAATEDNFPDVLTTRCFQRSVALHYEDTKITSYITGNQSPLAADFVLEGIEQSSSAFAFDKQGRDSVAFDLTVGSETFQGTFAHTFAPEVVTGDQSIQFTGSDSVIIRWQNPGIPLDTLQWSWFVVPYSPVAITSVSYKDRDSDGRIDAIEVVTDQQINPEEEEKLTQERFIFPSRRALTYKNVRMHDDYRGFTISVSQHISDNKIVTDISADDTLRISDYQIGPFDRFIRQGSYAIEDEMAPVLTRVQYLPSIGEGRMPRLRARFSEGITPVKNSEPFKFITGEGQQYALELEVISHNGSEVEFRVLSRSDNLITPSTADSVWISQHAFIEDYAGNTQVEPNRKVALSVEFPHYDITVAADPNPSKVGVSQPLLEFGSGFGTVIVVSPDSIVRDIVQIEKVEVKIFDSVGNLLARELPVKMTHGNVYVHWDSCNLNRRTVGPGTYLAVVSISSVLDGKRREHNLKIKLGFST